MRKIKAKQITETVSRLAQQANFYLPQDVLRGVSDAYEAEKSERARKILSQILENAKIAEKRNIPLCQDTGIAQVFLKLGQEAEIVEGDLTQAINDGVKDGYSKGYLRMSILFDPLNREKNTGTNTPCEIYTEIVPGSKLEITFLPKGGGSENASALKMLNPSEGWNGVKQFVLETVKAKGANACPPLVVGVGIGGSFSSVGMLAKKALLRDIGKPSECPSCLIREKELLKLINGTGIGPMGLGGKTTAFSVNIMTAPCHIATLPVAVSMQCHSCRRKTEVL
jgi:fumarate hydratase subunit alpha